MDYIIFIEVLFEIGILAYPQSRKHLLRICSLTVICCQHVRRIRLSEPTRSAIADIGIRCIENAVCVLNQTSLIHIYSGVKSNLKRTAVWVYKSSHAFQTPFWSCPSSPRLQLSYYSLILSSDRANSKFSDLALNVFLSEWAFVMSKKSICFSSLVFIVSA